MKQDRTGRRHILSRAFHWIALAACLVALYKLAPILVTARVFQIDDFVEYWAAGRLNLTGGNPYSPGAMESLQAAIGRTSAVMMWNPPLALAVAMPFGLMPYPISRLAWLILEVVVVFLAATWLWDLYGGSQQRRWLAWAVAFLFSATQGALHKGQISPFILLGIVGFLRYQRSGKPCLAGAFAALVALKPHFLYLFWIALLLWSRRERQWAAFFAAGATVMGATLVAMIANPAVVGQYIASVLQDPPIAWHTPTLGGALRAVLGPEKIWLQFAPLVLGLGWLLARWRGCRGDWRWEEQMSVLVAVSVISAAYGWTYDQVVMLTMILPATQLLAAMVKRGPAIALALIGVAINAVHLGWHGAYTDDWFWWLAPLWLAWYLAVRRWGTAPARPVVTASHFMHPAHAGGDIGEDHSGA